MLTKITRILGVIIIIGFSAISIFFSLAQREIEDPYLRKILSYPSFFEDRFYDIRMMQTLDPKKQDERLVLVAIDDETLQNVGRWPFTRLVWARLLKKLKHFGVKVIAFDVFFPEEEQACNTDSPDIAMANSIKDFQSIPGNKIILPYSLGTYAPDGFKEIPDTLYNFIMDTKQAEGINLSPNVIVKSTYPIPTLSETEAPLGHIQVNEDADGIFRHYRLVANVDTLYFSSYSLIAYQMYTDDSPVLEMLGIGDAVLKLKTGNLSLNYRGEAKVRWLGDEAHFPITSIYQVLEADEKDEKMHKLLNKKLVFIGSTAYAAHDLRHTPVDAMLPGIFFHMNMTNMLLDGNFFKPKDDSTMISWGILIGASLLMILIQLLGSALIDLFTVTILTTSLYLFDTYYLLPMGYEIKLFFCLFSVVACYSWTTFLNFYLTSKEKKKIRGTFSRYVAPSIVDQMLDNPDKLKVGGEKKNITVFFSDVRDFTSISEKLSPEQLSTCLNQYMGIMTDLLFENYGTLDKYIGDAIVAYWGAPITVPNHAYHAVKTSLKMIEILPEINKRFEQQGFPEFKHGIGLNTGDCSVGNMGSDKIFSYTALGDSMNLGARLESLCKYYGVQLNLSEYTIEAIPEDLRQEFTFRTIDKVRVKGKEKPVTIFEGLHSFHPFKVDPQALIDYEKAYEDYLNKNFKDAGEIFSALCNKYPEDKSSKRLKEFCDNYIKNPPSEDWDGVFTHTTKG